MTWADLVNGGFEGCGAVAIFANCAVLRRDKRVRGVSPLVTAFFTSWGFWNLYYYPSLDQWASFVGGVAIVAGNLLWLTLAFKYRGQ